MITLDIRPDQAHTGHMTKINILPEETRAFHGPILVEMRRGSQVVAEIEGFGFGTPLYLTGVAGIDMYIVRGGS